MAVNHGRHSRAQKSVVSASRDAVQRCCDDFQWNFSGIPGKVDAFSLSPL